MPRYHGIAILHTRLTPAKTIGRASTKNSPAAHFLVYLNDFANSFKDVKLIAYYMSNKSTTLSGLMAKTQTSLNAVIAWTRSSALALN